MRCLTLLTAFTFLCASLCRSQSFEARGDDTVLFEKITLLSDLRLLEDKTSSLTSPLAKAAAGAEIADAAWELDVEWAKTLVRQAFEHTLPPKEEQERLRNIPAGAIPALPSEGARARDEVRNRVLSVARRDKNFADELMKLGAERLGKYEEHYGNSQQQRG
jgi:hypothetical protein